MKKHNYFVKLAALALALVLTLSLTACGGSKHRQQRRQRR